MPIKVLHTSDWHLGKRLFKYERIGEQKQFLDWLYHYIVTNKIDILLIAGDIFDVPSPPNTALKLFYDFIFRLSELKDFETVVITGNHDSASMFKATKLLLESHRCYVYHELSTELSELEHYYSKNGQTIGIKLLPYFRNFELQNHLIENNNGDEENIKPFFQSFFSSWSQESNYKILMAHHVFGAYELSGSEHAIFLSGVDHFPLDWVKAHFDYIALGHIHKKQVLSEEPPIIYTGSPIPYRFSESNQKYMSLITVDENGAKNDFIEIPTFNKLIQVKTNDKDLKHALSMLKLQASTSDAHILLEVFIDLDEPKSGLVDEIRASIKDENIELISFIPNFEQREEKSVKYNDVRSLNLTDLFEKYYFDKYSNENPSEELKQTFITLLNEVKSEDTQTRS